MESVWRRQTGKIESKNRSKENRYWDVIVIGAGLTGLLSAYYLQEQGKQVLVLEADEIASGQTERTTAKITSQ
ncbi:MAG: FAD-dependent oxidoreductase, partial [Acetivibrio ethanolgignens]